MRGGFSFNDVDIADIGLEYAPELQDTYVYQPAETSTHIETFDGHQGGYFYGAWRQPKEFILRCYFEEQMIDKGILGKLYGNFRVGQRGKLIFKRRPWCYYNAVVTEVDAHEIYNYENGVVVIKMKAMYPFARSDIITNSRAEKYHDVLMQNSAVFDKENMELPQIYSLTEQTSLVLANQGTERAALGFYISGDAGTGVIIGNKTTGQTCKMVAISKAKTTDIGRRVFVDPINGKTTLVGDNSNQMAFLYHEYGFLELESSYPAIRGLYINYYANNTIAITNIVHENLIGKYMFIKNKWHKVLTQPNKHTVTVDGNVTASGSERTMVIPMNEITITPVSTMDIEIEFVYKPTYA